MLYDWRRRRVRINPVHRRNQRWIAMHHFHSCVDAVFILQECSRTEIHAPLHLVIGPVERDLVSEFLRIFPPLSADTVGGLSDVKMFAVSVPTPPVQQHGIICDLESDVPIQLWRNVVNPSFPQPPQYIGVKVVVVGLSGLCFRSFRVPVFVSPNTKRTYAEFDMGLFTPDPFVKFLNKEIYIAPPPVVHTIVTGSIGGITATVGKDLTRNSVRVKVIVKMNGVEIIMLYRLYNGLQHKLLRFGMTRIVVPFASVSEKPFGMLVDRMCFRESDRIVHAHPVWVEPCMKFKTSLACLPNHKGEWVVVRFGSLPLPAGKVFGPGFE